MATSHTISPPRVARGGRGGLPKARGELPKNSSRLSARGCGCRAGQGRASPLPLPCCQSYRANRRASEMLIFAIFKRCPGPPALVRPLWPPETSLQAPEWPFGGWRRAAKFKADSLSLSLSAGSLLALWLVDYRGARGRGFMDRYLQRWREEGCQDAKPRGASAGSESSSADGAGGSQPNKGRPGRMKQARISELKKVVHLPVRNLDSWHAPAHAPAGHHAYMPRHMLQLVTPKPAAHGY